MRYDAVPMEEAQKRLKENGATTLELALLQEMYAFLQFKKDCKKELEGLKEIMPYCFHMHGKFHYLYEDLTEASIPYEEILHVVKESDYNGYIVSEYEDKRVRKCIADDVKTSTDDAEDFGKVREKSVKAGKEEEV